MRSRLRRALADAIKARDHEAVSALRSALAAIDNAEAVDAQTAPPVGAATAEVASSVAGVGAAEVPRRALTESEVETLVRAEVAERLAAADDYEHHDQPEHARRLRREAEVLRRHLPDAERA